ncbi:MAG TPA: 30S ribosomal protein S5 [Candidatus Saccharimonadales bacterium]|nr:30S ribosomal protein S5 [Candidatus Saccharimonadales bacterium]
MKSPNRRHSDNAEEKQFDERVVHIDRVARVVKGGRRFRFRALIVIGDHKNRVGVGIAKGADVTAAVTKATEVAKKHLISIHLYNGTIPHEAEAKVSGAHILLKPASPGTGLIAGGVVRTILEVAGVSNVLSKSIGSSNKSNVAYATIAALQTMKPKNEWITSMKKSSPLAVTQNAPGSDKPAAPKAKVAAAPKTAPKKVAKKAK